MPYQVYKVGEKYCVYKKEDGKRVGKSLGCHPSESRAKRQMRAIYASENAAKKSLSNPYHTNLARLAFYAPMAGGYPLDADGIAAFIQSVYVLLGLDAAEAEPVTAEDVQEYIQELSDIFYTYNDDSMVKSFSLRRALAVTSNAYKDREREIIQEKALKGYVEDSWDGDNFVGTNPFLLWHGGEPIGQIVYADMVGPFLLEVAQERPDTVINIAEPGQKPMRASVKAIWDALAEQPDLRASHRFAHILGDEKDGEFEQILKLETSVLPGRYAANPYTLVKIL